MKLHKLCCLLLISIGTLSFSHAQTNGSDSMLRHDSLQNDTITVLQKDKDKIILSYLVISSKDIYHRSRVFEENKRLLIKTYDGRKFRGRLKILNDSCISLYNTITQKEDSFKLAEIRIVRSVSLISNIFSAYSLCLAPLFFIGGISTIMSPDFIFDEAFGAFLVAIGFSAVGASALLYGGIGLNRNDFDYHIHHAKGYILKPYMVKYLYPPTQ